MSLSRALTTESETPLLLDARGHLVETGQELRINQGPVSTIDSPLRLELLNEAMVSQAQTEQLETAAAASGSAWRPNYARGARSAATPVGTRERVDKHHFDSLLTEERVAARLQAKKEALESRRPLSATAQAARLAELLDLATHIAHARYRRLTQRSRAATHVRRPEDVQRAAQGQRASRETPLTRDDLFLTSERPPNLPECKLHHQCGICSGAKSHPVSHYGEEDGLAADYPEWHDNSAVDYGWDALRNIEVAIYELGNGASVKICFGQWLGSANVESGARGKPLLLKSRHDYIGSVLNYDLLHSNSEFSQNYDRAGPSLESSAALTKTSKMTTPRPASTVISRRRASAKYRERNEDELRDKARQRMARLRECRREDANQATTARAWACEDSTPTLSLTANGLLVWRIVTVHRTFEKKHGRHAWLERQKKLEDQRREAQELKEFRGYEEEYQRALRAAEEKQARAAAETLQSLGSRHFI
ncbi:hypothetical protein B0H11DRAFT_1900376 [Mycena galericulata]|nr:hypothetical protein B0H11DRAFT_1900376 [Mycena galericulata]